MVLVDWLKNNDKDAEAICSPIASAIHHCFPLNLETDKARESLWEQCHQVWTSKKYSLLWHKVFIIGKDDSPILAQYVGDHVLNELIKQSTPIEKDDASAEKEKNELEVNALLYAAGYVPWQKKLKKSANPFR